MVQSELGISLYLIARISSSYLRKSEFSLTWDAVLDSQSPNFPPGKAAQTDATVRNLLQESIIIGAQDQGFGVDLAHILVLCFASREEEPREFPI